MKVVKLINSNLSQFLRRFSFEKIKMSSLVSIYSTGSSATDASTTHTAYLSKIQSFIPKLTSNLHKGQCGRIGVIGGSFEYTGAPYFAAISSLKLGSDLVYVFCSKSSGPIIKSYSPELIVFSVLDDNDVAAKIMPCLEKLHSLVIGPGLGRDKDILQNVGSIITLIKDKMKEPLPLIIDADGLFLITENINLIKDYNGPIILTPNVMEFSRLSNKLGETSPYKIASLLNVILLQKGSTDVISNGLYQKQIQGQPNDYTVKCDIPGSNRRCGGQGDILSGFTATFLTWLQLHLKHNGGYTFNHLKEMDKESLGNITKLYSLAAYGACVVARTCSRLAFDNHGRSVTTSDMISCIGKSFQLHFGQ